nr:MAG: hypothetical protein [Penaeus semisulcatus pemonivirus]
MADIRACIDPGTVQVGDFLQPVETVVAVLALPSITISMGVFCFFFRKKKKFTTMELVSWLTFEMTAREAAAVTVNFHWDPGLAMHFISKLLEFKGSVYPDRAV